MKLFLVIVSIALAKAQSAPEGCVNATKESPLDVDKTPQFIVMSFDDAATKQVNERYYKSIFNGRMNPDGNPIKATFLVPHEYTDYQVVNQLYNEGHEIGVHSITKNAETAYWQDATVDTLVEEFSGQKEIISTFANVPLDHIQVVRTPHLQLAGDKSFEAYQASGLSIDSSWTALSSNKLFPYNLQCKSNAHCSIGQCPEESYDDIWVSPINNIQGNNEIECNTLFACQMNKTQTELTDWLLGQLEISSKTKTPFSLLVNSAWFAMYPQALDALNDFIDAVLETEKVYFVSHSELINWAKDPVEEADFRTEVESRSAPCNAVTCVLKIGEYDTRYMGSCVTCPEQYPWLGNPQGTA